MELNKTEKAIFYDMHKMLSKNETIQALQEQRLERLEKKEEDNEKKVSKLTTFSIQAKVIFTIFVGATSTLFKYIMK